MPATKNQKRANKQNCKKSVGRGARFGGTVPRAFLQGHSATADFLPAQLKQRKP